MRIWHVRFTDGLNTGVNTFEAADLPSAEQEAVQRALDYMLIHDEIEDWSNWELHLAASTRYKDADPSAPVLLVLPFSALRRQNAA